MPKRDPALFQRRKNKCRSLHVWSCRFPLFWSNNFRCKGSVHNQACIWNNIECCRKFYYDVHSPVTECFGPNIIGCQREEGSTTFAPRFVHDDYTYFNWVHWVLSQNNARVNISTVLRTLWYHPYIFFSPYYIRSKLALLETNIGINFYDLYIIYEFFGLVYFWNWTFYLHGNYYWLMTAMT